MQMAASGEVLLCGPLYERIRHLVPAERVATRGDVTLRGKSEAIPVFAVRAAAPAHA
jgi:class 3 adenylate cyclase